MRRPNAIGFEEIMSTKDLPTLFKLSKLCKEILSTFKVIYKHVYSQYGEANRPLPGLQVNKILVLNC